MLNFLKTHPNESIYNENKIGPRIEPWGTPQETLAEEDDQLSFISDTDFVVGII